MSFTHLLNQVNVRTHWITSLLSVLHDVRLGSYGFYAKLVTSLPYLNGLLPFKEEIAVLG